MEVFDLRTIDLQQTTHRGCEDKQYSEVDHYHGLSYGIVMNELLSGELICHICGKPGAKVRHVSRSYGRGDELLVIENVPVISCPHCGESYLTADTLHEIERIKLHRQAMVEERSVPVAVLP